jgi:CarD family transcriptional regulator
MLKKGDAVVHPNHGAGVLESTQTWQVSGVERQYHCIELVNGRGTLFIPTDRVEEVGLILIPSSASPIVSVLFDEPQELTDDYQKRKANLVAKIHSGDILLVAEALRDLAWRKRETKLSGGDEQVKAEAQELLAGVLALQLHLDIDAAIGQLNLTIHRAIQDRLVQDDGG